MSSDNLIAFQSPEPTETFHDAWSELVRTGARQIIAQIVGILSPVIDQGTGLLTGNGLLEALLDKRFEPSSAK
jgi:hypothetical protein